MKFINIIVIAIVAVSVCSSCVYFDPEPKLDKAIRFRLLSSNNEETQSGGINIDSLYVNAFVGEKRIWDTVEVFSKVGQGDTTYSGNRFWPTDGGTLSFYVSNSSSFVYDLGKESIEVNDITMDVVCGKINTQASDSPIEMTLNHIFARIGSIEVKNDEGFYCEKIEIKAPNKGTYDLKNQEWESLPKNTKTKTFSIGYSDFGKNDKWIIPNKIDNNVRITYKKTSDDNIEYTCNFTLDFEKGIKYTITIQNGFCTVSESYIDQSSSIEDYERIIIPLTN